MCFGSPPLTTYQGIFALHHLARKRLAVLVNELKGAANLGPADPFGRVGNSLPVHAPLFEFKIPQQCTAGCDEEDTCFP